VNFRKLLQISRPRFWIYLFGPYIVGLVCGASTPSALLNWRVLIFGIYFLLPANLFVYGTNDVYDWETDQNNPKKKDYETLVTPRDHAGLSRIIIALNLPFILGLLDINSLVAGFGCFSSILGFWIFSCAYSAPPIRAKTKPVFDSVFNVLYIFPGVFGYYLAGGAGFHLQPFFAAWLWAAAMHAYSAIPDISADRNASTPTVATLLGFHGTLWFCLACYFGAALLAFPILGIVAAVLGAVYLGLMLFSFFTKTEENLMRVYKWFPLVNTTCGFVLFWAIALHKFYPEVLRVISTGAK
jgi:4-hydroxybenzoate polyprenyltransferase